VEGLVSTVESYDSYRQRSYFGALDGLRGVSILLVLLHHATRFSGNRLLQTLQENGRYGVAFFFAISGFLICTLFLQEEAKTGRIDLWKFYGRRALRLLPLYYSVLLLQAILVFSLHQYSPENQQLFRDKLGSYVFYYSNWLPTATQGPFFCAWSLAVEEQFYLAFGLLLFCVSHRVVAGVALGALIVKAIVYQLFGAVDAGSALCRVLFSYREPILLGVLLAFLLNDRAGYNFFARLLRSRWTIVCVAVLTAAFLGRAAALPVDDSHPGRGGHPEPHARTGQPVPEARGESKLRHVPVPHVRHQRRPEIARREIPNRFLFRHRGVDPRNRIAGLQIFRAPHHCVLQKETVTTQPT
jgi:peptidoglycan/LPS O-acetylase OafA/YrhL